MRIQVTFERRTKAERDRRWEAKQARRARKKVRKLIWPEESDFLLRDGAYRWTGGHWLSESPNVGSLTRDEYVPSPVLTHARHLIEALENRARELEDPCS